jgi:tyrosinase
MTVELQINNNTSPDARFFGWAPSPCRIRITNPSGTTGPSVNLQLTGKTAAGGDGQVVFRAGATGAFTASITLSVPTNGGTVPFFAAGKFGKPSSSNGDVSIEVRSGATLVTSVPVMVRIRKNANTLSTDERDRFVAAFAKLNNQGLGRFRDFRDMHVRVSLAQAHGAPGFLPWHRAYLLDLERDLQAIDPSVALPYWRFDLPAPNIFTRDFFGEADPNGAVQFSATNPLQFWRTDGDLGVNRSPLFPTSSAPPNLINEAQTLDLGGGAHTYKLFRRMEGNPHGSAHVSFDGSIDDPATAPKDPLFFLLHCNVDRLWAKWQRNFNRFDPAVTASFDSIPTSRPGHKLGDTMWPWNGVTGGTRPPTAPGGPMSSSSAVSAPGLQPRVEDVLDYHGTIAALSVLGFDYDDVAFA